MFKFLIFITNLVFPLSAYKKVVRFGDLFFSAWLKKSIPHADRSSDIYHGATIVGGKYLFIGEKSLVRKHANIQAIDKLNGDDFNPQIVIGKHCDIGEFSNIVAINKIVMGNHVLLGRRVTIVDHAHGEVSMNFLMQHPSERRIVSKGSVYIDDDVWICDKVTICAGVHIGKGCVIAANSVVTKSCPPYSLVGGIPAKIIKQFSTNNLEEI